MGQAIMTTDLSASRSATQVPEPTPADIQGWVVNGYGSGFPFVRHLVFTIHAPQPVRDHLRAATSGADGVTQVHDARQWTTPPESVLGVGFTHSGLAALGVERHTLAAFPTEYRQGPAARAAKIGDYGASAPECWDDGMADPSRVHMIWTVHAQTLHDVQAREDELTAAFATAASIVQRYDGENFYDAAGKPTAKVHFGYVDGISQPRLQGFDDGRRPDSQPVAPYGSFFAGHESQFEGVTFDLPEPVAFTGNGTYNAFRVLEQDVVAFEQFLHDAAEANDCDVEWIAAKVCGRWRNGNPLPLDPDDPDQPPILDGRRNDYGYFGDDDGAVCPIGSHMRRANPRDADVVQRASAHTRRVIRRGVPYGPEIAPGTLTPDGIARGLLGNFMCGSLIAQFEGIMYDWINLGLQHPDITGTNDPVLGANDPATSRFVIPRVGQPDIVLTGFPRFIRTRASAYTFLPSLPGLRWLAAR
jgi:Dyp-type peroxidase family